MDVTNVFHCFNIISKLKILKSKKNLKDIMNLNYHNLDYIKLRNSKKTLFVCSHDYCFADILAIYLLGIKTDLLKNTYIVARKDFGYLLPGIKLITRENTTERMIDILNNNENVIVFYSRIHIDKLNIDKLIKKCDINIIPIQITCNTLDPISHNIDGVLENIDMYLHNTFTIKILDLVKYDKEYTKQDFISQIKKVLYPDGGYFDKDIFIKNKIQKINNSKLINI